MSEENYYTVLGVAENATTDEIKSASRSLLKKIHPDTVSTLSEETRRSAEEATRYINEAYSVLSDPGRRAEYDYSLAEERRTRAANPGNESAQLPANSHSNSNGATSGDLAEPHRRRRRRRRHRSHRRRSGQGHMKSLFRPVSVTDWLVLFAYIFLAVVLVAITVVIISSAPAGSEDSSLLSMSLELHLA